jgi:hypothetical protein
MKACVMVAAALALCACGDVDQSMSGTKVSRGDEAAYKGAHNQNMAKGWEAGNRDAWNKQIRERGQLQNEYVKTNR